MGNRPNVEGEIQPKDEEDKRLLIKLYKIIIEKPENQISVLQQYHHLLDRPISIGVRVSCTCINLFEQHPGQNKDPTENGYNTVFKWMEEGRCKCYDSNQHQLFEHKATKKLIHVAAIMGNKDAVEYLLSQGCNVNEVTSTDTFSPLFLAIVSNNVQLVKYLITKGADVNQPASNERNTPLIEALLRGEIKVFAILLCEPSIDINARNRHSETVLTLAAKAHNFCLIRLLVSKGAHPNHVDRDGFTPLMHAVSEGDAKLVEVLIENGAYVNRTGGQNRSPLHIAVLNESKEIVKILLKNGANPNAYTHDGYMTPLLIASGRQTDAMLEVILLLLIHKADVDLKNRKEYTALHIAAWDGFLKTVKILLAFGAKQLQTEEGNTPFTLAAHGKHVHVLEYLLELGCDVNHKDKDLDTAIHYAAYNGDIDSVRFLLHNGAQADVKNRLDVTPLWHAVHSNAIDVVKLLINQNVVLETPSVGVDEIGQPIYAEPKSPLWVAATKGYSEIVMLLIEAEYNIYQENWLKDSKSLPTCLEINHDLRDFLIDHYNTPPRLLAITRNFFRKLFGSNADVKVLLLDIPSTLRNYITGKDIV